MVAQTGFIYLGASPSTDRSNYAIAMPFPNLGETPFEQEVFVDAARNGRGETVGRVVGRPIHKLGMAWTNLKSEKWYEVMRWLNNGHFSFYCHYFNFNLGYWQTKLFYHGNAKCTPGRINPITGEPYKMQAASLSVIDCGVI